MLGRRRKALNYQDGNDIHLMENGESFFPELIRKVKHARHEVLLETFILEDDRVGRALKRALLLALKRGAWVCITIDGWGSYYLNKEYIRELTDAGAVIQIYDPQPHWYNGRPKLFRRIHRKLAVIDGSYAFIGGINLCNDHMITSGPEGKQDYAVRLTGPIVEDIRSLCKDCAKSANDQHLPEDRRLKSSENGYRIAFVSRDNHKQKRNIERSYLAAMRSAKKRIWIVNAYFFPGYRFIRTLIKAKKRGVDVKLVIQGDPDIPFSLAVARTLYDLLLRNNISVYEFRDRPLHAKIAVIDDEWSTIGSSNLDPLSLGFNLEANILVDDKRFNDELAEKITELVDRSVTIEKSWVKHRPWYLIVKDFFMFHLLRRFPAINGLFPAHSPRIREIKPDSVEDKEKTKMEGAEKTHCEGARS